MRFAASRPLVLLASFLLLLAMPATSHAAGLFDTTFAGDGVQTTPIGAGTDQGLATAVQADGKVVVAGWSSNGSNQDFAVARYDADGTLDPSFSGDGVQTTDFGSGEEARAVVVQSDGKIVVGGYAVVAGAPRFALARYDADGSLDPSFSGDGLQTTVIVGNYEGITGLAIQSDGKIVATGFVDTGGTNDYGVVRYDNDGTLDASFDADGIVTTDFGGGYDDPNAIAVQADDKIVVTGGSSVAGTYAWGTARYDTDGSLDPTFGTGGRQRTTIQGTDDRASSLVIQPDDKIVLAGDSYNGGNYDSSIARLNPDGSLDPSFNGGAPHVTDVGGGDDDFVSGVALASDGGIVTVGGVAVGGNIDFSVIRYLSDGSIDATFDGDGIKTFPLGSGNDRATGVAIQPDGKIVVGGFSSNGSDDDFAVVRLLPGPGVTSVAVPPDGTYLTGSTVSFTVNYDETVYVTTTFGTPTIPIGLDSGTAHATYVGGSGTTALTFEYTVSNGDFDADGITLDSSIFANGGTVFGGTLQPADPTLASVASTTGVLVGDTDTPSVSSIVRAGASPTNAASVAYTVTFDEAVTGVDAGDFALTGTGTAGGSISAVTGSGSTYSVTVGSVTGDGTLRLDLNASGTGIADLSGNAIASGFTTGATYSLDHTAPSVNSVGVPASGIYATGANLDFVVHYDESVTVDTSGGTPYVGVTLGTGGTVHAAYVSGSGSTALTFRYVVAAGNLDADGVTVGAATSANGSTIRDAVGNDANATLTSVGSTTNVLVDGVAPTVASVVRAGTSPTNGPAAAYTVTFSEAVTGVDASDFTVTASGASGSVSSVSGSGSTYTVSVGSVNGTGTLRLDVNASGTGINDAAGNALSSGFTTGEVYTVDRDAPSVTSVDVPANATYAATQHLDFVVHFDEAVNVVTSAGGPYLGVTLNTGGTVHAVYLSGTGTTALTFRYVVAAGDLDADGVTVAAAVTTAGGRIRDAIGNDADMTLTGVGSTVNVLVDGDAPTVTSVVRAAPSPTNAGNVPYTVTFSKPVTGVDTTDFTVTASGASGSVTSVTGSGATYAVNVGSISGSGVLRLDVKASGTGIASTAGNALSGGFTTGEAYSVDRDAPVVTNVDVPANGTYVADQALDFIVHYDEAVTVVTASGAPSIDATLDTGGTVHAAYLSGSGTTALTFRYVVVAGNRDVDGIALGATVTAGAGSIRDAIGNDAAPALTGVPTTSGVRVDGVAKALTVVLAGTGAGTVTADVGHIACATGSLDRCQDGYADGSVVRLTAAPAAGSTFAGWSAPACAAPITVHANVTCTATFTAVVVDRVPPPPAFALPTRVTTTPAGRFAATFTCPATEISCTTTFSLTTSLDYHALLLHLRRPVRVVVRTNVTVAGGHAKTVVLRLPASVRAAVAAVAAHRRATRAVLREHTVDAAGNVRDVKRIVLIGLRHR